MILRYITGCLVFVLSISYVSAKTIIYDTNQIHRFRGTQPFYVQLGAFKIHHYAIQAQGKAQHRYSYPVYIKHRADGYYVVMMGPIRSNPSKTQRLPLFHRKHNAQYPYHKTSSRQWFTVADLDQPKKSSTRSNYFMGVQGSALWSMAGDRILVNNHSDLDPPMDVDIYSANDNTRGAIGLVLGETWHENRKILPDYGLGFRYQHLFQNSISGDIEQYSLPQYNNYSYTWGNSANTLTVFTKLNLFNYYHISPYIEAGLGVSFNQTMQYQETAFSGVTPRISPDFGGGTNTAFAYHAGVGVDIPLTNQWSASIGYEYQNLGKVSSKDGRDSWSDTTLSLGNYQLNSVVGRITYWF